MEMFCEKTLFSLVFSRRGWFRVLASSGKVHWIRSERENREQNNTHTHKSTKEKHSFAFILLKFMQYKKGIEWTLAPNENNTNEANKQVTNSFLIKSQHQKEKLYLFIALLLLFSSLSLRRQILCFYARCFFHFISYQGKKKLARF